MDSDIFKAPVKESPTGSTLQLQDVNWMRHALKLAKRAYDLDEVPVGAVLVKNNQAIGEGYNQPIASKDPTAHAEILAIRSASSQVGNYRLPGTTLYVTLEPCAMCVGAIVHSRIQRLVFGASEPKAGAVKTNGLIDMEYLNHRVVWDSGVLQEECGLLVQEFFLSKRAAKREKISHES